MRQQLPLIIVEVIVVFGGALAFGWWQFRSIRRDRERAVREKAAREQRPPDAA
jgi:DNA-binding transcriptional regulator of glucitol operon